MGGDLLSETNERGQICLPCQRGNLFYCSMSEDDQSKLGLRGFVNSKDTPILPLKEPYVLINSPEETINKVEIEVAETRKTVIENISEFGGVTDASELKVFMGIPQVNTGHVGSDHTMPLRYGREPSPNAIGIGAFEIADAAGLPIGPADVSDITDEQKAVIGFQLGEVFGIDWEELNDAYSSKTSGLAQSVVGIAEQILASGGGAAAVSQAQRAIIYQVAVFEALVVTETVTIRQVGSALIFAFKTKISYLKMVKVSAFVAGGHAAIDTRMQAPSSTSSLRSAAGGVFKGTGGAFLVIGAGLNIATWLSQPAGERFLSDLFVDLAVMVATAVVSAIAAVALVAVALPSAGAIVGAIAVGATAMLIGWGITAAWEAWFSEDIKSELRDFMSSASALIARTYQGATEPLREIKAQIDAVGRLPVTDQVNWLNRAFGGRGMTFPGRRGW